jgi:hypothetical protein
MTGTDAQRWKICCVCRATRTTTIACTQRLDHLLPDEQAIEKQSEEATGRAPEINGVDLALPKMLSDSATELTGLAQTNT